MEIRFTHPLTQGAAVRRAQHQLAGDNVFHQNFHPGAEDGVYGQQAAASSREAKFHLGWRLKNCTDVFGDDIRETLNGTKKLGAGRRARRRARRTMNALKVLRAKFPATFPDPTKSKQVQYVTALKWGIAKAGSIHYSQEAGNRIHALHQWLHALPISTDCSGSVKAAAVAIGVRNWDGVDVVGYTGTILNLPPISRYEAKPGDFCVFGPGTGSHVVSLLEPGRYADPRCFSHGQESGPSNYPLSVESAAHPGQELRFRRNPVNQ